MPEQRRAATGVSPLPLLSGKPSQSLRSERRHIGRVAQRLEVAHANGVQLWEISLDDFFHHDRIGVAMKQVKAQTTSSAAEILGITPQYVRTLVAQHGLGEQVVHGRYILYQADMDKLTKILAAMPARRPRISQG